MQEVYRGIAVVVEREWMRFTQERTRIVAAFGFPLLYLLVFGAGFSRSASSLTPGVSYLAFLYPGVISMMVLQSALTAGTSIVWERQMRLLRALLVAPISRGGILLGKVVWAALLGLVEAAVMVVIAPLLGVHVEAAAILELIPVVIVLSLWLAGLGLLIGAWMESVQAYQTLMQFVSFPLIFTAGVFFPLRGVPAWLQILAKLNPATYGVDAVRRVILQGSLRGGEQGRAALDLRVLGHTMSAVEDTVLVVCVSLAFIAAAIWSFNQREGRA